MSEKRRKPVSISLEDQPQAVTVLKEPGPEADEPDVLPNQLHRPSSISKTFKALVLSVLGLLLVALALDLWLFTKELLAIRPALGYAVLGLATLASVCLIILIMTEIAALGRIKRMSKMRAQAEQAIALNSDDQAIRVFNSFQKHCRRFPALKSTTAELDNHKRNGYDGIDLLQIAEKTVLSNMDKQALRLINSQARATAVLTTISPYAIIDVLITLWRNMRMIRQLAEIYGSRPGFWASTRLMRQVFSQIAITGAMEAGDGLVSEVFGGSFLSKLSTKLGEAIINGLLTARIGLTAMDQIRPLPFRALPKPKIKHVASDIAKEFKDRLI